MKTKRLTLNKQTIASLGNQQQTSIKGKTGFVCKDPSIAGSCTSCGICPKPATTGMISISLTEVINPGIDFEFDLRTRFEFDYRITGPSR